MSTTSDKFDAKTGGNSHKTPEKPLSTQVDNLACAICGGEGVLVDEATGNEVMCQECNGSGKATMGKIFDGQRLDKWRENREHRQDRRRKMIDRAAEGIGGLFGLPALPGKILALAGSCCTVGFVVLLVSCVVLVFRMKGR